MSFILQVKEIKENFPNQIFFDENLSKYSWFNLGGPAKILFKPDNTDQLIKFLKLTKDTLKINCECLEQLKSKETY